MKHVDKKLSDDFAQFLNQKLFFKNGQPLKQTQKNMIFFNKCTAVVEEFICTYIDTDPILLPSLLLKNPDVISMKATNPVATKHGCTVMTQEESIKADKENNKRTGVKNEQ